MRRFVNPAVASLLLLAHTWALAAAPTFVGKAEDFSNDDQTNLTLTLPAHATDDFGLITCTWNESGTTPTVTDPTGYTVAIKEIQTDGRDRGSAIYHKKFTSGSETNPTIAFSAANSDHSCNIHIFRGVHTSDPLDATITQNFGQNERNPTNEDITPDNADAAIVLIQHSSNGEDISAAGAPSGYTLGDWNVVGGGVSNDAWLAVAYLLGATGLQNPGAWTNTGVSTSTDYTTYTVALRAAASGSALLRRRR